TLFAAFLGYSPIQHLVGPHVLAHVTAAQRAALTGRSFFPNLISTSFANGLHAAFDFAIVACVIAAGASWLRGGKYVYTEPASAGRVAPGDRAETVEVASAVIDPAG
ncbi:MAG: MFS transporter, partial [Sciscionella sp.]